MYAQQFGVIVMINCRVVWRCHNYRVREAIPCQLELWIVAIWYIYMCRLLESIADRILKKYKPRVYDLQQDNYENKIIASRNRLECFKYAEPRCYLSIYCFDKLLRIYEFLLTVRAQKASVIKCANDIHTYKVEVYQRWNQSTCFLRRINAKWISLKKRFL